MMSLPLGTTIQKAIGMDLPHQGTSFTQLSIIRSDDPLSLIDVSSWADGQLRCLSFATTSNQTQGSHLNTIIYNETPQLFFKGT